MTARLAAPRWLHALLQALTGCVLLLQDVRLVAARYKKSVEGTGDLTAEDEDADMAVMPKAIRWGSLEPGHSLGTAWAHEQSHCNRTAAARRRCRDSPPRMAADWRSPGALHCRVL